VKGEGKGAHGLENSPSVLSFQSSQHWQMMVGN